MNKKQFKQLKNILYFGFLEIVISTFFLYARYKEDSFEIFFSGIMLILGVIMLYALSYKRE